MTTEPVPDAPSKARAALSLLTALLCLSVLAGSLALIPTIWAGHRITAAINWWDNIPVDLTALPSSLPGRISVVDVNGAEIATFYSENRVPVTALDQVSPAVIDAVLAVEDAKFYDHGPIDVTGTARAFLRNQTSGTTQGGSTLTQQYVKNLRIAAADNTASAQAATETSLHRKIVELKWASELEKSMTKDQILLGYLNIAYFGNGAYGVGAAAQFYFGAPASDLTVPQAALLAGLLKNPTGYDPIAHPVAATARRATALGRMVSATRLTQAAADVAKASPLGVEAHALPNGCTQSPYPYYCDWVKAVLLSDVAFGADETARQEHLYQGGFVVHTALDPATMTAAQNAVDAAFSHDNQAAAAIAIVEPGTGHVPAIAQSRAYDQTQFSYPVQAQVQPGSTFKAITYTAALEAGFDPAMKMDTSAPYKPAGMNSPVGGFSNDHATSGQTDARGAMKASINTWFVRLVEKTGTQPVADVAYRMGMTSMNPATRSVGPGDASITLGAFETTPLDLANTYATLAANGVHCRALPIVAVTATDGTPLPAPDSQCEQAVEPSVAATVASALTAPFEKGGTAEGISIGRPAAGKTGTTNDFGATWFAGFTPQLATAVWVGDPRGPTYPLKNITAFGTSYAHLYGATVAAPIWAQAMSAALAGKPVEPLAVPGPLASTGREVPDVTGLSVRAAISAVQQSGFTVSIAAATAAGHDQLADTVVSQVPTGGSRVGTGERVDLTLTDGSDTAVTVQ